MKKNALRLIVSLVLFTTLLLTFYQPAYAHGPDHDPGHDARHERTHEPGRPEVVDVVTQRVSAQDGGVLQAGGVTLTIPGGALDQDVMITMQVRVRRATGEITLLPSPLTFNFPVTLDFGRELKNIYFFENGTWVWIASNASVIQIDHFSRYGWW